LNGADDPFVKKEHSVVSVLIGNGSGFNVYGVGRGLRDEPSEPAIWRDAAGVHLNPDVHSGRTAGAWGRNGSIRKPANGRHGHAVHGPLALCDLKGNLG
jgi:hypothetical protein